MKVQKRVYEADVLVVGGGIGGCFAAIEAKKAGAGKVIQLDKGHVGKSGCSAFGAGAISAFCPDEQDYDAVFKDVLERGHYLVDQERLRYHLLDIWSRILEMDSWGVVFEKRQDGSIDRMKSRGSTGAIMFHGPQMMDAIGKVPRKRGVENINKVMMTDLLTRDGRVVGATALDFVKGELCVFKARATILATGCNRYKGREPMHRNCTGDGQAAAYRAGTDVCNVDIVGRNCFVSRYDIGPGMTVYAGTGARFINGKGEYFMEKYDPEMKDRALLGVIIPAMSIEVRAGNGPIYFDMTHFTAEQVQRLRRLLPIPMKMYERVGIVKGDRFVERMEWMTTSPRCYFGPNVNARMETCLPGLYAIGDCTTWAGFEGGQSLLAGAITGGAMAGKSAAEFARQAGEVRLDEEQVSQVEKRTFEPLHRKDGIEPDQVELSVLEAVVPYDVLTIKSEDKMKKALKEVEDVRDNMVPYLMAYDPHYLRMALEARNMTTVAEMQLRACIFREESRGRDVREDYPYMDNDNWLKWVEVKEVNGRMTVGTQDIPFEKYPVQPPRGKFLNPIWKSALDSGRIRIEGGKVVWA